MIGKNNEPLYTCDCTRLAGVTAALVDRDSQDLYGFKESSRTGELGRSLPVQQQFLVHAALDRLDDVLHVMTKDPLAAQQGTLTMNGGGGGGGPPSGMDISTDGTDSVGDDAEAAGTDAASTMTAGTSMTTHNASVTLSGTVMSGHAGGGSGVGTGGTGTNSGSSYKAKSRSWGIPIRRNANPSTGPHWLGILLNIEDEWQVYGHVTATNIKFFALTKAAPVDKKVKEFLERVHSLFIQYTMNPFQDIPARDSAPSMIRSSRFDEGVRVAVKEYYQVGVRSP